MNTVLDSEFTKIASLKWLPWVGAEYLNLPTDDRMLIVGESHYHEKDQASIDKHERPSFTREIVLEHGIEKYYSGTKMFPNLHRALFGDDSFNGKPLWDSVAFYNFIQRPMETKKGRPSKEDYINGWKVFFDVVKVIKPKTCLFNGTTSANELFASLKGSEFSCEGVKWDKKIRGAYAKSATITTADGDKIELVFIRHTSQMFSHSSWREFLQVKIPNQMKFLEDRVKVIT